MVCCCCRPYPSTEKWWKGPTTVSMHTGISYPPHLTGIWARWWLVPPPFHSTSRCSTSTGAVHKSVTCSCVFMLVQLNKCSDLQRGHSGDGCLTSAICLNMNVVGDMCLFWVGPGDDGLLGGMLFRSHVLWVVWCLRLCCVVGCWGMCWLWWCECVSCLF